MTDPQPLDFEVLIDLQRQVLSGEPLSPEIASRIIGDLLDARFRYEFVRRVLDRWATVRDLHEYLKIWLRQNGQPALAEHIDHVVNRLIGGQP